MNPDGSDQTNLSNDEDRDDGPNWSPDGTKIAFEHGTSDKSESVWVMNADGTDKTMLTSVETQTDENAAWSPDGKKLAFVSDRDGHEEIYVMNADGSDETRLTDTGTDSANPDWGCSAESPVGGEIIPVDMASLFVAGAMTNTFWTLPTLGGIAGAAFALFKINRKHD